MIPVLIFSTRMISYDYECHYYYACLAWRPRPRLKSEKRSRTPSDDDEPVEEVVINIRAEARKANAEKVALHVVVFLIGRGVGADGGRYSWR